jgi:Tol biopolymer transport system component
MNSRKAISTYRLLFLLIALAALPAHATFPGKNGRIAFVQAGEIFTMNPDGSDVQQLTHVGPENSASWPAWSADGKQIVFNEFPPPDGKPEIWVMDGDGGNQRRVFAEKLFDENRPSFSPDGSKVVFGRCKRLVGDGDTCAIHTVNLDGSGLTRIVPYRFDDTQRSPMYSPDGKTIAFIISPDASHGFQGVTYLVNADGTNLRRITEPAPCLIRPDWSPDGTKITTFAHLCNPQNETIAVMNADGSDVHYLTQNGRKYFTGPRDRNPAFSPDGNFIVFERHAPDFETVSIYVMRWDGSGLTSIATLPRPKSQGQVAASGRLKKLESGGAIPRWGVAPE